MRLPAALIAVTVCAALPAAASADGPYTALQSYTLRSWTVRDGLPSDVIWSIAEDRDGYLWLTTNAGLVRFDGMRFVVEDFSGSVAAKGPARPLLAARDGSLWVGFLEAGGVTHLAGGRVRHAQDVDALRPRLAAGAGGARPHPPGRDPDLIGLRRADLLGRGTVTDDRERGDAGDEHLRLALGRAL